METEDQRHVEGHEVERAEPVPGRLGKFCSARFTHIGM